MTAQVLDGHAIASRLRERLTDEAARFARERDRRATITLIGVGDDPTAALYAGQVVRSSLRIGLDCTVRSLPGTASEEELRDAVTALGKDQQVDGVVVLLPLPRHIRQRIVMEALAPEKDIDGLGPRNAGRLMLGFPSYVPSTADAALELLRDAGVPLRGRDAVVIGRSNVGGKPAALLLLREEATVTICHSRTADLAELTRQADIIFTSTGRPHFLTREMVKQGAVVLDAGMNALDGGVVGDVDFASVREVASYLTPVPGGLGPLTNLILIRHALLGPT
jgi:methylenetetrahydrofolate dehydrogenase (NADP+) / methenyltetrahydrofolate cyclohydrolase